MRVFIGIKIPPNDKILKVLESLKKFQGMKHVEPENVHICLKFLGEIDEERIIDVKKVLDSLNGFGSFEIKLKSVGAFPNQNFIKVIWIGAVSDKLISLAKLIDSELERFGFRKETRKFVPHITLARVKKKPLDDIKQIFSDEEFGSFEAKEVELIQSMLKPTGPEYTIIHKVSL